MLRERLAASRRIFRQTPVVYFSHPTQGANQYHMTSEARRNRSGASHTSAGEVGGPLQRFAGLVKTLQFAWFAGHVVVLLTASMYLLGVRGSSDFHQVVYSLLYLGVLESFGIIVYQQHFNLAGKQGRGRSLQEFVHDENFLYCMLAAMWLLTPRFAATVPPFAIFSSFHALTYLKGVLLPVVFRAEENNSYMRLISGFLRDNHDKSLSWSCNSELACFLVVFLRALACRRRSWIVLALYSLFIKARYEKSANMRAVVRKWEVRADGVVSHPRIPAQLKRAYAKSKMQINRLGSFSVFAPFQKPSVAAGKKPMGSPASKHE
ncbi:AFR113Wp [Eremothecium gossypii ATCC 10895]|uniref:AFR113Wp n=1 Tax=Eremothecium gossypii (strain ATCC 10895 / CBS 109.51 / FGSC 9923 / NRRL Y-1056) TaxID=284811 RepID=Q754F7_EREGS|nr:AFR113Wp [Eremothecium gossypii ATCC 10895]AAS53484.1 AFR113Wp [Eremothecium gossypii ATCC 10895]AEY97796.1 FAFR113Wp [Eremothecium gossypii FDAG1]